jgi:hypothetical protein
MTLEEGLELIKRHADYSSNLRLWKPNIKIALLETCYFLKTALGRSDCKSNPVLMEIVNMWVLLQRKCNATDDNLAESINNFVLQTDTTSHYSLCTMLVKQVSTMALHSLEYIT